MYQIKNLIFLLVLILVQCKKDETEKENKYFIEMTISGKKYFLSGDSAFRFNAYNFSYFPSGSPEKIGMGTIVSGRDVTTFNIRISDTTTGGYVIRLDTSYISKIFEAHIVVNSSPYNSTTLIELTNIGVSQNLQNPFMLKINRITKELVEGEFSGTLRDEKSNEIQTVSNGQFRMAYVR